MPNNNRDSDQSGVARRNGPRQPIRTFSSRDSQSRDSGRSRRGRERRMSVRSEMRGTPDVRRIANTVIAIALAQAEAEAHALQRPTDTSDSGRDES